MILYPLLYIALGALVCAALTGRRVSAAVWFGVGCGVAILAGMVSALLGMGRLGLEVVLWLSPVALAASLLRPAVRARLRWLLTGPAIPLREGLAIVAVALGVGWLLWRIAGVPPVNYDLLSYHLPLALEFARADGGRAVLLQPETFYARLPLGLPLLDAPLVPADVEHRFGLARHGLLALAILCGMTGAFHVARRLGGRRIAPVLAAGLFALHPLLVNSYTQALGDVLLAVMGIAAVELLVAGTGRRRSRRLVLLAGFVAGSAATMKFSAVGVLLVPLGVAAACWTLLPWREARRGSVLLALLVAGMVLALGPWLVRAAVVGGHPLHPFQGAPAEMAGEPRPWTAEQAAFVVEVHGPRSVLSGEYWLDVLLRAGRFGYTIPLAGGSLLLLAALASLLLLPRRIAVPLLAIPILGYLAWLGVSGNPTRFLLPALGPLFVLAALALERLWHRDAPGRAVAGLVLVLLAWQGLQPFRFARTFDPVYTATAREEVLDAYLGGSFMRVVRAARPEREGALLLLFEARPTLFPGRVVHTTVWDQPSWAPLLREAGDGVEFGAALRREGITRVFVNEAEWGRFLAFYASEEVPLQGDLRGRIGLTAVLREETIMAALAAYPPFRFAGFTERDLTVLREFLLWCRSSTLLAIPAGPGAEVWLATIPESPSNQ